MRSSSSSSAATIRRLCVFCGSSPGSRPDYARTARDFGTLLANESIGLVYGGGKTGLMGEIADAALAAGGEVIGVIPEHLEVREIAHRGLSELRVVSTMHERKATMADLSDGFVGLPGGLGTLEEFFEVATWRQLGIHDKPAALLDVRGYYDLLDRFLDHAVEEGFLRAPHRALVTIWREPAALLEALRSFRPTPGDKWLDPPER
ncbi:MAG TPA: TIGR00730 family Rossman fold protein [Polyangiaceae bacterium]|jgi:uncharacterized protein (TIGR00730 family)|nr:TIGR00730 family Rossman fold protein [Polyangiaceae bacterium]